MATLASLRTEIAARVESIREASPWWPCAAGCADCCRQLARPLELPAEEWRLVDDAYRALPAPARREVLARAHDAVARHAAGARHVACPFLDDGPGTCRIYEARPSMCRAYGYYAARAGGGHCTTIEREVSERRADDVLWGNLDALERELGARVPLASWLAHGAR